ncbi:MAG: hypothetical protein AAGD01_10225 [Acidobacteriota bacterium]
MSRTPPEEFTVGALRLPAQGILSPSREQPPPTKASNGRRGPKNCQERIRRAPPFPQDDRTPSVTLQEANS